MHSNSTSGSRLCLNSLTFSLPLKALALSTLLIPFHSINASKTYQYDNVVNHNKLTVVSVENPTTVFKDGQHLHGFGYDLARNYADSMNVQLLNEDLVGYNIIATVWYFPWKVEQ